MNMSLCTISFRHQLISLEQIVQWAAKHEFQGIELWGVHGKNLRDFPQYHRQWLTAKNLKVSMISDYLPLGGDEARAIEKMRELCQLARFWGAKKIRTFAGDQASATIRHSERSRWSERLKILCDIAAEYGLYLLVETHPDTLADTLTSTLRLLQEVNHAQLKINFDVIHLWEAGDNPQQAFTALAPYIMHMHFKNIRHPSLLENFNPANVYAPAGSRQGMVSVFEGAFDFSSFLHFVCQQTQVNWQVLDVSLEWFGDQVLDTLNKDRQQIKALTVEPLLAPTPLDKPSIAV